MPRPSTPAPARPFVDRCPRPRRALLAATALVVALATACAPPDPPGTTTGSTPPTPAPTAAPIPTIPRATTTTAAPEPVPQPGSCPSWSLMAQPTVAAPALIETSGLAGGQLNPGVWWTHNDSGDVPRVFALEGDGRLLSTVNVAGADAWDWEDIDVGPGPGGQPYLWVADVGDNAKLRQGTIGYQLYRFPEPALGQQVASSLTVTAERFEVVYPDGPHNVEATLVDPVTGDYFIITKEATGIVFRIPAASLVPGTTIVPSKVGQIVLDDPTSAHDRAVGADISADGSMIVVKTLDFTWFWRRAPGTTVAATLAGPPCAPVNLGHGEAIAFNASGGQLATLAEGNGRPLMRFARG